MTTHIHYLETEGRMETAESDGEFQQSINDQVDCNTELSTRLGADQQSGRAIGESSNEDLSEPGSHTRSLTISTRTRRTSDSRLRNPSLEGSFCSVSRENVQQTISIDQTIPTPHTTVESNLDTNSSNELGPDSFVAQNSQMKLADDTNGLLRWKQRHKPFQGSPASVRLPDIPLAYDHPSTSAPNFPSQPISSTAPMVGSSPYVSARALPPVHFPRLFEDPNLVPVPSHHNLWDKMDMNHPAVLAARKKLEMNPLPDLPGLGRANGHERWKGKVSATTPGHKGLIGGPEALHAPGAELVRGHAKSMSDETFQAQIRPRPADRVRAGPTATNHPSPRSPKPASGRDQHREHKRGQNRGNGNKSKSRGDSMRPEAHGQIPLIRIHGPTPANPDEAPVANGSLQRNHSPRRRKWSEKIAGWFWRARTASTSSAPESGASLLLGHAGHAIITSEMVRRVSISLIYVSLGYVSYPLQPVSEVLELLREHGCQDITEQLDVSKSSDYPISFGGFGEVYRGSCRNGDRVAIKCLRLRPDKPEVVKKQLKHAARELFVWSKCNHPNVLGLTGMAQYRNQIAMVSPWMEYGNVRHMLSQRPQVDRYALCAQIIDGVIYLHGVGIIHGDLKGDNVLVSEDLTPKLTDFGNAALREYTLQFSDTTGRAGTSLNWVAPEILAEETGLTAEGDVFSLGMTVLEVITGTIPYADIREAIIVRKILDGVHPIRPVEHLPPDTHYSDLLWSLLESCWAYEPEKRPTPVSMRDKMKVVISERKRKR